MAKTYHAAKPFDIGGEEITHFNAGDSVPASHPNLEQLVTDGYVAEGKHEGSDDVDPATGLSAKEAAVYEENEGSVADAVGTEVDVVGVGTPDAEDVRPASKQKRASTKRSTK